MRTHAAIIDRPTRFAHAIGADPNRVKAWKRTDSIPAAYWARVKRAGLATLDELASAAEARAFPQPEPEDIARTAPHLIEQDPVKPGSALLLRAAALAHGLDEIEIELPDRNGHWRDISFLFEDD